MVGLGKVKVGVVVIVNDTFGVIAAIEIDNIYISLSKNIQKECPVFKEYKTVSVSIYWE